MSASQMRRPPLELSHSWPLFEKPRHFELGLVLNCAVIDAITPSQIGELAIHHVGCWECDLSNNALSWSGGIYDVFGLPRDTCVTRGEALSLYSERSRAAMERLREYGIRHKRGFTLDIELRPATGGDRWVRLVCAPVCEDDRVVCLQGLKIAI